LSSDNLLIIINQILYLPQLGIKPFQWVLIYWQNKIIINQLFHLLISLKKEYQLPVARPITQIPPLGDGIVIHLQDSGQA